MLMTILLFVIGLAATILYPQPLFANKVEYNNSKSHSNDKIGDEIKPILDSAISIVEKSELYDPDYKVDIFLAYNSFFNKVDDKVFGLGPSARAIDNNLVIKVKVDIRKTWLTQHFINPVRRALFM